MQGGGTAPLQRTIGGSGPPTGARKYWQFPIAISSPVTVSDHVLKNGFIRVFIVHLSASSLMISNDAGRPVEPGLS